MDNVLAMICVADYFIQKDKVKSREQQILIKRMIYMLRPDYEQRVKYNILKDEGSVCLGS